MMTQHTMPANQMILQTSGVIITASLRYQCAVTLHQSGTDTSYRSRVLKGTHVAAIKMPRSVFSSCLPRGRPPAAVKAEPFWLQGVFRIHSFCQPWNAKAGGRQDPRTKMCRSYVSNMCGDVSSRCARGPRIGEGASNSNCVSFTLWMKGHDRNNLASLLVGASGSDAIGAGIGTAGLVAVRHEWPQRRTPSLTALPVRAGMQRRS